jgi:hypothetical protein
LQIRSIDFVKTGNETIIISRNSTHIQVVNDDTLLNSVKRINEGSIMGIVGIINVEGLNFLAVINQA